jgi:hypothetical protein
MSEPPDCTLSIIHTKGCLLAILAGVESSVDLDCEETLEKIRAAANAGLDHLNAMLDVIAEARD